MKEVVGPEQCEDFQDEDAFWRETLQALRAAGRGHDHDDDVQETLLGLLGLSLHDRDELLRLRWTILRRRKIDRYRAASRRAWEALGAVPAPVDRLESNGLADALLREHALVGLLGERAVDLLMLIVLDGARATHAIARRHGVARSTTRVRRARICRILRRYLAELERLGVDGGPA